MTVGTDINVEDVAYKAVHMHGASQDVAELAQAISLIKEIEPRIIVEIGCDRGGTLFAWCQLCENVFGITTEDNSIKSGGSGNYLNMHEAKVHRGDSHELQTLTWLTYNLRGRAIDALIIDGDHSYAGVAKDIQMYAPLVRVGGLILLHDIVHLNDFAQVYRIWPALQADYQCSEIRLCYGWGIIRVQQGDRF